MNGAQTKHLRDTFQRRYGRLPDKDEWRRIKKLFAKIDKNKRAKLY